MSTGVVTNTRVTHATPACAYATSASRAWEADTDIIDISLPIWPDRSNCKDIASQLIEKGHDIEVSNHQTLWRVFVGQCLILIPSCKGYLFKFSAT